MSFYTGQMTMPVSCICLSVRLRITSLIKLFQMLDDLPYYVKHPIDGDKEGLLMVPYSLDSNDFKFFVGPGFTSTEAFENHIKNAFE